MKILHVVRHFLPATQTFIFDHLVALNKCEGVSNSVLYYGKRSELAGSYDGEFFGVGELVERYLTARDRMILAIRGRNRNKYRIKKAFENLLQNNSPDIIHCHFAWGVWQFLYASYQDVQKHIPLVISVHGTDVIKDLVHDKNRQMLVSLSFLSQVKIVATSQYLEQVLIDKGVSSRSIRVVENSINPVFGCWKKSHLARNRDEFRIVYNARFVFWKGHHLLLEAFTRFVQQKNSKALLILIGGGELKTDLEQMAKDRGIAGQVLFPGFCSHEEVARILSMSDVYIHTSIRDEKTGQHEGFGVAIIEAMAVGLPVIASNIGGIPFAVGCTSKFVRLVTPGDVNLIFSELVAVYESGIYLEDNDQFVRDNLAKMDPEHHLQRYLAIYGEILERPPVLERN